MTRNEELGDFLRARRAALDPAALGILDEQKRRVPGLRREELAQLAGVSVDYYTRLEQGRPIEPSDAVLDAIAGALQLDRAERNYLETVAVRARPTRSRTARSGQVVRPGVFALIEQLGDAPAYVLGRRTDVLAANRSARALLADFPSMPAKHRNAVRWVLLDDAARLLWADEWERIVAELVGALRMDAARYPDDPKTTELVGELSIKSEHFRKWWAEQKVVEFSHGTKRLHHPVVGDLTVESEVVTFPGDPDQALFVYLAKPGTPSEHALKLLAFPDLDRSTT
ncbi:helix-turn-helix transcriptional regulator [Kribbella sp. NPDC051770]|uniref:helix-turn-helix transcriptional regulator n=1 Tax=Kribbella sp. NPDC051770 TaxID=3155413 RepID=UPI00341ECA0E